MTTLMRSRRAACVAMVCLAVGSAAISFDTATM